MVPFRVLAELEKFQEAQAVLDDLCKEYPDNYRVQIDVAGTLLNGKPCLPEKWMPPWWKDV